MAREVSESCMDSLLTEIVSSYSNVLYASKPELAARRIEAIGYHVGHQLSERYTMERPRFSDHLEAIKFICKDFWSELFKKQIDNLKTNHRGTLVLQDDKFAWLSRMSAVPSTETQGSAQEPGNKAAEATGMHLYFPCGIIRGALSNLGIPCAVSADISNLPAFFKHLQEDKDRHEKLNSLLKSFQQADNENTQIIHALQEKPYLSSLEQEYLNLLRLQCMKDWENTSACGDLCTRLRQQIQVKEEFLSKYNVDEAEADMNMESDEQPIGFASSAEEFFLNGDRGKTNEDQYCKISFLPNNINCCRSFWGVLLGYTENTILWEMHVDAWVRRSLFVHVRLIAKETVPNMTRYAVVPVSFHDDFVEDNWQTNTDFANGSKKPFLAWRHADSVLIPICCPDKYWFLIQYNVDENELTIWNRDEKAVPNVYMQNIVSYYRKNILYFTRQVKNIERTAVPPPDVEPFVYKKQLTQYPGSKANSAVFLCIIIHKLLRGEHPDAATADVSEEQVTNFRKSMANVLYAKRTG